MSHMPPSAPPPGGALNKHRGGLILGLGIASFICFGIILGPIAFILGSKDIKEMDAGRMDPQDAASPTPGASAASSAPCSPSSSSFSSSRAS